jgi:hypothetical protein
MHYHTFKNYSFSIAIALQHTLQAVSSFCTTVRYRRFQEFSLQDLRSLVLMMKPGGMFLSCYGFMLGEKHFLYVQGCS